MSYAVCSVTRPFALAIIATAFVTTSCQLPAQSTPQALSTVRGEVFDPSGALVPGASVTLATGGHASRVKTGKDGTFSFPPVPSGFYILTVEAAGFSSLTKSEVKVQPGGTEFQKLTLAITVEEKVEVSNQRNGVSLDSNENAGATIIQGADLDALSDDPNELQNQLRAIAGSSAGPNGGQIYIDGFTGGQLPPKSSIREIRINQNPFSAEF